MYLRSSHSPRPRRRLRRQPRARSTVALELGARIAVNGLLIAAAGTALVQLVPRIGQQRGELHQMQTAVSAAESQNLRLKADFSRYFDPQQAGRIVREQSGWDAPSQRQIVWTAPAE